MDASAITANSGLCFTIRKTQLSGTYTTSNLINVVSDILVWLIVLSLFFFFFLNFEGI